MGIDRHELEHRNWRRSASKLKTELDRELAEQLDTSVVSNDEPARASKNEDEKVN